MDIRIDWNETFSIGEPTLDQQHRELFEIIHSLPEAGEVAAVRQCLMRLFRYTRIHFAAEEEYMTAIGYPQIDDHRASHEALISCLNEFATNHFDQKASHAELKRFALRWLTEHILLEDKSIQSFAQARQKP